MKTRWAVWLVALCGPMFGSCTAPASSPETRIAVASSVREPLAEIALLFEAETGHRVTLLPGSTGKHVAQIMGGAPVDALFGADALRPARLEQDGLTVAGSRFTYAYGRLVLWTPGREAQLPVPHTPAPVSDSTGGPPTSDTLSAPKGSSNPAFPRTRASSPDKANAAPAELLQALPLLSESVFVFLLAQEFRFLAIANPRLAPYGQAARQVLERLGAWEELQGRIVRGENIGQTFSFLRSGNAEWGFIALSQISSGGDPNSTGPDLDASTPTSTFLVPADWHTPIEHQAVLLSDSDIARQFCTFVRGDEALTIWKRYGFTTP